MKKPWESTTNYIVLPPRVSGSLNNLIGASWYDYYDDSYTCITSKQEDVKLSINRAPCYFQNKVLFVAQSISTFISSWCISPTLLGNCYLRQTIQLTLLDNLNRELEYLAMLPIIVHIQPFLKLCSFTWCSIFFFFCGHSTNPLSYHIRRDNCFISNDLNLNKTKNR